MFLKGQGATEYLVLLAVVLIIALILISLLGFFPGTASDAQITETQLYWKSATPIAVIEASTTNYSSGGKNLSCITIVIRNTNPYGIQLSKILGGGVSIAKYNNNGAGLVGLTNLSLAPGEQMCFSGFAGSPCNSCKNHEIWIATPTSYDQVDNVLPGATEICGPGGTGQTRIKNFGFEYVKYIEGQSITKQQIGSKDLIIKCVPN